jgi:hypothetical protein
MSVREFSRRLIPVFWVTAGAMTLGCATDPHGLQNPPPKPVDPDPAPIDPDPIPTPDGGPTIDATAGPDMTPASPIDAMVNPKPPAPVSGCNFGRFLAHRIAPEILLVFDRSSAMRKPVVGSPNNRWIEMTDGVATIVKNRQAAVSWGLKFFPSPSATASPCLVNDGVDVAVGPAQFNDVITKIRGGQPDTGPEGSPLFQAVSTAMQAFPRGNYPRYFVLASDGQVACPAVPANPAAESKAYETVRNAANSHVWSFVIGTATVGTPQHTVLNNLAGEGREAAAGPTRYQPAQNKLEMMNALDAIADKLSNCLFSINAPPWRESVALDIQGLGRVPRDVSHLEGWDYGPDTARADIKTVQLFGTACNRLRQMPASAVDMTFGCQNVPPPINQ